MNQFFVVDVGNTHTKWALADDHRILKEHEFPTTKFTEISGRKIPKLNLPERPCGAIISCVVPQALPGIKACLHSLGIAKPLVVSSKMNLGIGIRYPKPAEIGADRLVNAVAAVALYGVPAVVVDFGTAITFDVVSSQKEYLGGIIAPGLQVTMDYLHERTALLPQISLTEPKSAIGKDTVAAMRAGVMIGFRGLVREILQAIFQEIKSSPSTTHVIATGGLSSLVCSKIPEIKHAHPQLTLNGLRLLYGRFQRKLGC